MCESCRNCWHAFCSFLYGWLPCLREDTENRHLLAHSISAIATCQPQLCQRILDSFSQLYLRSTTQSLDWDVSNTVNGKTVVICAKLSRLQDDIQATLNRLDVMGNSKIMLVVIHACEQNVTPDTLLMHRPDDRVTSFTNVIYSTSTDACYDCLTNREAATDIKRFIK
ncbi:uncharacterized protein LOC130052783 [Ostrea edulis]|uniref:uncharacterized protein LOC130052783 n=1 Tax=Ostrea edulis TaxID=37623 RepID=UPI0024AEE71E|nr:uncharacterized protein LOC130052783 [Ostrea edulis]